MCFFKSLSKTFMTVDVRATGRQSFRQEGLLFLGTGMMTDILNAGGNHRGSKGLIKDGSKQTSKLIGA